MTARRSSRAAIVAAIIAKDWREFSRDRFWLFMTALALVWFIVLYYLLPSKVNETITVGVHWTDIDATYDAAFPNAQGIAFQRYDSAADLETALGMGSKKPDKTIQIGIDYPEDFLILVATGKETRVRLIVAPSVPQEVRDTMAAYIRESAYQLTGHELPIGQPSQEEVVLGEDRAGSQISLRERTRPLYAFIMLMMETFALGALTASEISGRTVTAILVTPARVSDFLLAKGVFGTLLAFAEASLLLALVRGFGREPWILLAALFLGAILATGVALIVGASGRDFIGMVFYSLLFLVPLLIPAVAVLFPGSASAWVKVLPTYGLVRIFTGVTSYGYGWSDSLPYFGALAAWCIVVLAAGLAMLRRKVESL